MFDSFTKNSGADPVTEGLLIGTTMRANRLENQNNELEKELDEWQEYAKKLERKLAYVAGERDAGIQTISAIVEEIKEIDKNPNKERFFSDPENRLSRTNFFKEVANKRSDELIEKKKLPKDKIVE